MQLEITNDNFNEEVLSSKIPVLVDFWASWCMPCRMVAPILDEIAQDYEGKIKVGKLNVDEQAELATKFNVVSIPTILLFKNGEVVKQHVGAGPRTKLEEIFKDEI